MCSSDLDAMGGDHAPAAPVAGALLAVQDLDAAHSIQLVGREEVVRAELERQLADEFASMRDAAAARISIVHADDVIEMTDKPSVAIRGKPKSSMVVGLRLQAEGLSDAFVSAGNTGAQMAASTVVLRLHDGLTRPAISTLFPTAKHPLVVLDSGANVDCGAEELVSFARLGSVYARDILDVGPWGLGLLRAAPGVGGAIAGSTWLSSTRGPPSPAAATAISLPPARGEPAGRLARAPPPAGCSVRSRLSIMSSMGVIPASGSLMN